MRFCYLSGGNIRGPDAAEMPRTWVGGLTHDVPRGDPKQLVLISLKIGHGQRRNRFSDANAEGLLPATSQFEAHGRVFALVRHCLCELTLGPVAVPVDVSRVSIRKAGVHIRRAFH
jgi:hypothetical protein